MLSKSQARLFFLAGTVLFSLVFLFLTVDTVRQVPKRTNQDQLTDAAARGKKIWDQKNCMDCHTLMGEGAYYAPELTKAVDRRGEEWLKVFLKDPQAMYPGRRKMTQYNFTDEQITDVIAFLTWVGKMDLNGYPAKHNSALTASVALEPATEAQAKVNSDRPEKFNTLCIACHSLAGSGGNVGPALDGVANRFDEDYLAKWIADPQTVKPGTAMPKLPLTDSERQELVTFLSGLK